MQVTQKVWFSGGTYHNKGLIEGVINKIGRKYFYVKGTVGPVRKFSKETFLEDSDNSWRAQVYLNPQDYHDNLELNANKNKIRKAFENNIDLSLEQSRDIINILGLRE